MNKPASNVATKPATPSATTLPATNGKTIKTDELRTLTQKIAYELWEKRGRRAGSDVQDWLEAEKIARQRLGG